MFKLFNIIPVVSVVGLLSACGGGSGAGSNSNVTPVPVPVLTAFPVQQAVTYAYTHSLQRSLSATGSASNGSLTYPIVGSLAYSLGSAVKTTFGNAAAYISTTTITGTITVNGQTVSFNTKEDDYLSAQYAPMANSSLGQYCVANAGGAFPVTASAGQSGDIAAFTCYTDSTKSQLLGTATFSYVATAGADANTLNFKMITSFYNTAKQLTGSGGSTFAVTAAGIPTLLEFSSSSISNGTTVNLTAK